MKQIVKFGGLMLMLGLLFGFTACGGDGDPTSPGVVEGVEVSLGHPNRTTEILYNTDFELEITSNNAIYFTIGAPALVPSVRPQDLYEPDRFPIDMKTIEGAVSTTGTFTLNMGRLIENNVFQLLPPYNYVVVNDVATTGVRFVGEEDTFEFENGVEAIDVPGMNKDIQFMVAAGNKIAWKVIDGTNTNIGTGVLRLGTALNKPSMYGKSSVVVEVRTYKDNFAGNTDGIIYSKPVEYKFSFAEIKDPATTPVAITSVTDSLSSAADVSATTADLVLVVEGTGFLTNPTIRVYWAIGATPPALIASTTTLSLGKYYVTIDNAVWEAAFDDDDTYTITVEVTNSDGESDIDDSTNLVISGN